ncbi:MAG: hypothetical protein ACK5MA_08325 [Parachlamydiaceae bacterium]
MKIAFCILSLFLGFTASADEGKLILFLGPSGVGKSTIIRHLNEMHPAFVEINGIFHAMPEDSIDQALAEGKFPLLNWSVDKMDVMINTYGDRLFTIYIVPESLKTLEQRLQLEGLGREQYAAGKLELDYYLQGRYNKFIDLKIVNKNGDDLNTASTIYQFLCKSIEN